MFSDITNHWARAAIETLSQRDLISGYPDGTFRPQWALTRAEFAALMVNVFPALPERQAGVPFSDISETFWAEDAIAWVSQRRLFSGFEDGSFRPQLALSRLQAIVVLEAGIGASRGLPDGPPVELGPQFSDGTDIPAWAEGAIARAFSQQLLERLPAPRPLNPNTSITRGEVAALVCRALVLPVEATPSNAALVAAQDRHATRQRFTRQEAGFGAAKLAFLDRGIERSPFQRDIINYMPRLKRFAQPAAVTMAALTPAAAYPTRGQIPTLEADGLDFLEADILAGCLCLATVQDGALQARWLGRSAFEPRQMWSATKFVPLLHVVDRANASAPDIPINRCQVRSPDRHSYPFSAMANGVVNYDNRIASSNALALTFKHFSTPSRLEGWLRQMTGSDRSVFRGRYGVPPFITRPELRDGRTGRSLLSPSGAVHHGDNLVSPYDLTRLMTMAGWHYPISRQANFPAAQGHSLQTVIQALGVDTARYADVALSALGLSEKLTEPVVLSKSGFGRSDQRDRTELTYCALIHFDLPCLGAPDFTVTHQRYALSVTLMAAKDMGNFDAEARYVDALMAAEMTEILRRVVMGEL